jgi:N-acetylglucosamine malate deacetylase 1
MSKTLVIAPHPDDETLGCGGTLARLASQNEELHWLIATVITEENGFQKEQIESRAREIDDISRAYRFSSVQNLGYPTTKLDTFPIGDIIQKISHVFHEVKPETIYLPYSGDVHTDHKVVFDATVSCTKWFRYPFIRKVIAYETISETDFQMNPDSNGFRPNTFVNISDFLERKLEIMKIYSSEIGHFPFPRSEVAIRALSQIRGSASGFQAAESFMSLYERIS